MNTRRRVAHIPMMQETRNRIALSMRMAVENMVMAPSSAAATEVGKMMAIITAAMDFVYDAKADLRGDQAWMGVVVAVKAMESIQVRYDTRAVWELTKDEIKMLRAAAAQFDHVLRKIPYNVYEAARIFVEQAL